MKATRMMGVGSWGKRRQVRLVAAAAAVMLVGGFVHATGATGTAADAPPDLVSDAPANDYLYTQSGTPNRLLLRFYGYVHNIGGPLEIVGRTPVTNAGTTTMTTTAQEIYRTDGSSSHEDISGHPVLIYESDDFHNHWHLRDAMKYSLYDSTKTSQMAPSLKVGFCLSDSEHVDGFGPATKVYDQATNGPYRFCQRGNPTLTNPSVPQMTMGISSGWRDIYPPSVTFQWVDVTDVAPGTYWLAASSDPDNVIVESDETNNGNTFAATPSIIPGFVAQPVSESGVTVGQSRQVPLAAQAFGNAGVLKFKIVNPPTHGTLDQTTGTAFSGPQVTYTPDGTYSGSDSFTYAAIDANSEFPHTPVTATVTLSSSPTLPTVSISGAPASMYTATSVQLTATVTGGIPSPTWSVNGVVGGTTQSGTVTSSGLYTAPSTPPAGGSVTIRAASPGAHADVSIQINPQPTPAPAPAPSSGGGSSGATPDLALTQSASVATATAGATIVYHLEVRLKNFASTSGVTRAIVTDTLPAGVDLVSTKWNRGPGCTGTTTITCDLDFLSGEIVGAIDIAVRVTTPGTLVNTASVKAPEEDPDPTNNTASVTVGPPAQPTTGAPSQPKTTPGKHLPLLDAPSLAQHGQLLVIGAQSHKAGRLEVSAWRGSSRLGGCRTLTPAFRPLTCQIRLNKGTAIAGIRVTVRLVVGGKAVALRHATYSRLLASRRSLAIYHRTGLECWLSD